MAGDIRGARGDEHFEPMPHQLEVSHQLADATHQLDSALPSSDKIAPQEVQRTIPPLSLPQSGSPPQLAGDSSALKEVRQLLVDRLAALRTALHSSSSSVREDHSTIKEVRQRLNDRLATQRTKRQTPSSSSPEGKHSAKGNGEGRGNQQPASIDTASHIKSSPSSEQLENMGRKGETREHSGRSNQEATSLTLTQQAEITDLCEDTKLMGALKRIDRLISLAQSQPKSDPLVEIYHDAYREISTSLTHYQQGRGLEKSSLLSCIRTIRKTIDLKNHITEKPSMIKGAIAEVSHVNYLISTEQAVSLIVCETSDQKRDGTTYRLVNITNGESAEVSVQPVSEADALYWGNDGKFHIDEVKYTARTLMGKIREKPDQLQNLSDWKNFDPQNREVTIVVHDDQHWPDIFIRITTKNAETTTVLNKLIEAGVRLKIGKHTLDTPQLERLRQTITQQLSDQNIGKPGGLRVKEFFEDMLEKSIMDVLEGGDATPQNA